MFFFIAKAIASQSVDLLTPDYPLSRAVKQPGKLRTFTTVARTMVQGPSPPGV